VCPVPGCTETSFQSIRLLKTHIPIAHPEMGDGEIKEWQLSAPVGRKSPTVQAAESPEDTTDVAKLKSREQVGRKDDSVTASKRRCQDQLRSAVEKKTRRVAGKPHSIHQENIHNISMSWTMFSRGDATQSTDCTRYSKKRRQSDGPSPQSSKQIRRDGKLPHGVRTCRATFSHRVHACVVRS
jgi:hypothetical protein